MTDPLRLVLVTDIHYGADTATRHSSLALEMLGLIARECRAVKPHLVLDMGDRFVEAGREADREQLLELARAFDVFPAPRRFLLGNHDVTTLSPVDNAELLGHSMEHASLVLRAC